MRRTQNGQDKTIVYEYPQDHIIKHKGVTANKYLSIFMTFDIETTNIKLTNGEVIAIMYIWQVCIGDPHGKQRDVYIGRSWKHFKRFVAELANMYGLNEKRKMLCFIHNAAFEFQFLRSVFDITRMFATAKRVPVSFDIDYAIECRCSYKQSNMSLFKFCEEEQAEHGKQTGFDYSVQRFPDTYLDDKELLYCIDDVLGLHEAISHKLIFDGDSLTTFPLTSTGYIRRDARAAVQANMANVYHLKDTQLNEEEYIMCKAAARGGNTHGNIIYVGQVLGTDKDGAPAEILGEDIKSSYPAQMIFGKNFPMGKFKRERAKFIIPNAANIVHIIFYGLKLKKGAYFPYIAKSKCESMPKQNGDYWYDNGRVLKAPVARMVITELDFEIIVQQYDFTRFEIIDQYVTERGYLCKEYRDFIYELFKHKCELENGDPYYYAKYKNKVNAAFGMMLTDITRVDILYEDNKWLEDMPSMTQALLKYYKSYNSFLEYQHGIYVTASARTALQKGLNIVGRDGIYCDTDSVKHFGEYTEQFEALNLGIEKQLHDAGYDTVHVNEKDYKLGTWERDSAYSAFITQGAKKYAYRYSYDDCNKPKKRGKIGVTVAGLNKEKGAQYLNDNGGLEAFRAGAWSIKGYTAGIMFDELNSGRLKAKYDDKVRLEEIIYDGHKIEVTSNVALVDSTYSLGLSKEYSQILEMRDKIFE